MKHRIPTIIVTMSVAGILTALGVQAQQIPGLPPAAMTPELTSYKSAPVEKVGNGLYRIGEIAINKQEKSISFPAQVNMDRGMLEYLIVYRSGKTHESLLRTNITPYSLQLAFMLLGYEGTDKRLSGQGSREIPTGEPVRITISNVAGKQTTAFPVEEWLANRSGDTFKDVAPLNWVFCGSFINDFGKFMSQETGSIIAIWHDPVAMIDNASPGGESNRIWNVKQGTAPAVGTAVTVTIKPTK
jgi:hypothetical protein